MLPNEERRLVRNVHLFRTETIHPLRFNIRDSLGLIRDEEGSELGGITAARQEAVASAQDFAMDDLRYSFFADASALSASAAWLLPPQNR